MRDLPAHGSTPARARDERGSGEGSLDRVFAPECLKRLREAVHVSLIWCSNEIEVSRGAHDAVCPDGKTADDHVLDLRRVERGH
jgi:hypothetical protein